jgi:AcrR family transcriptional regulator
VPRQADPQLEDRVLKAAQKLWTKGGQKSLTMRSVAKAAGTNTPAVYRRFKDRRALLRALLQKHQATLAGLIRSCNSLQEVSYCLLDYALKHPREYELIASRIVITSHEPRPNFEYVLQKTGEWLGGEGEQYRALIIALWSLLHGTAMLLINDVIPEKESAVRSAFKVAVEELVRNHARFKKKK